MIYIYIAVCLHSTVVVHVRLNSEDTIIKEEIKQQFYCLHCIAATRKKRREERNPKTRGVGSREY
jgi:hypothetical protein